MKLNNKLIKKSKKKVFLSDDLVTVSSAATITTNMRLKEQ